MQKRSYVVFLFCIGLAGCTGDLIAPAYRYDGEWMGTWTDPTVISSSGSPLTDALNLVISEEGVGSASGSASYQTGQYHITEYLLMNISVDTDGAVYGSGRIRRIGGAEPDSTEGYVIGQFNRGGQKGEGVLRMEIDEVIVMVKWAVEKIS